MCSSHWYGALIIRLFFVFMPKVSAVRSHCQRSLQQQVSESSLTVSATPIVTASAHAWYLVMTSPCCLQTDEPHQNVARTGRLSLESTWTHAASSSPYIWLINGSLWSDLSDIITPLMPDRWAASRIRRRLLDGKLARSDACVTAHKLHC